jgi:serine/threonine protein kinase
VFDAILNRDPPPPVTLNANVPASLERIIARALEKDRALRYQSAADIRADLLAVKRERERTTLLSSSGSTSGVSASQSWRFASGAHSAAAPAADPRQRRATVDTDCVDNGSGGRDRRHHLRHAGVHASAVTARCRHAGRGRWCRSARGRRRGRTDSCYRSNGRTCACRGARIGRGAVLARCRE